MLIGHQKQWQYLSKLAKEGKLPHAFLFSGQEKLGKKTVALEFIKSLNCHNGKVQPCQVCRSCQDIQKRIHPDLTLIEPSGKEIQISQIRELIWRLSLKASISFFKVAIIDQAHCMNQEAQNCFLKTLEEPKGNALLILISEYPEALFPTILSRVQKIKFYAVAQKEIENYLKNKNVSPEEIKEILEISQGKTGMAIDLTDNPKALKAQKKTIADLIKIANSDLALRFQCAKDLSLAPDLKEDLNTWLFYFRNILLFQIQQEYTGSTRAFQEYTGSTRAFQNSKAEPWKIGRLAKILEKIQETFFLISTTNVNPRLALEILMLEF